MTSVPPAAGLADAAELAPGLAALAAGLAALAAGLADDAAPAWVGAAEADAAADAADGEGVAEGLQLASSKATTMTMPRRQPLRARGNEGVRSAIASACLWTPARAVSVTGAPPSAHCGNTENPQKTNHPERPANRRPRRPRDNCVGRGGRLSRETHVAVLQAHTGAVNRVALVRSVVPGLRGRHAESPLNLMSRAPSIEPGLGPNRYHIHSRAGWRSTRPHDGPQSRSIREVSHAMTAESRLPRGHVSVRSYKTDFELDETPISEGGRWINGKTDGLDWTDVVTGNGYAHGSATRSVVRSTDWSTDAVDEFGNPAVEYDDPTAVLGGEWGRDQHAKATVFSRNQTDEFFQEVEIRLRTTITPHLCTGYEVFWNCRKTGDAYAQIVRWNGKYRDWTTLAREQGPEYGVQDGDLVEATVVGNVIRSYINGVEVLSATDDTFSSGSPGIGFNLGCDDTYVDHGFTYFEVDTANG